MRYAAADDLQKAFSNVLFDFHDDPLTVVGADGFRLVIYTTSGDNLTLLAGQDRADLQIRGPSERILNRRKLRQQLPALNS